MSGKQTHPLLLIRTTLLAQHDANAPAETDKAYEGIEL